MEFKEIKVATLSKEDKALFKEMERLKGVAERAMAEAQDYHRLVWSHLTIEHNLFGGNHHLKGNSICKRCLE